MRVAIIHYWLFHMRGGEKVVEALCRMFPDADIFTHVYDPADVSDEIRRHRVQETFIGRLPWARRCYQTYLPLMPYALEQLDLSGYDLIISSEAGPAKGIIPPPNALHVCYCHSPMRYLWDQYHVYRAQAGALRRVLMPVLAHRLRTWDVVSAARVDHFIANSTYVAEKISKYYRRTATVVPPPVDVDAFAPVAPDEVADFYLWAGELVSYKRPDLAVDAFNRLGKRLVVIGDGPERAKLQRRAKPNIEFHGRLPFDQLRWHFARCRALIFPGVEDFGIIPVEVMASGRPVVAYRRGGALDTMVDGETGVLFNEPTIDGLADAVQRYERDMCERVDVDRLRQQAQRFAAHTFEAAMRRQFVQFGLDLG